MIDVTI